MLLMFCAPNFINVALVCAEQTNCFFNNLALPFFELSVLNPTPRRVIKPILQESMLKKATFNASSEKSEECSLDFLQGGHPQLHVNAKPSIEDVWVQVPQRLVAQPHLSVNKKARDITWDSNHLK